MPRILLLNGSLHGATRNSNTLALFQVARQWLKRHKCEVRLLSGTPVGAQVVLTRADAQNSLRWADGIIVGTGTHWGQSSSTLQHFLEDMSCDEGSSLWLGKPVGLIVSEHSTGGQAVLSNLMLTFSNFGCVIPPQAGMVFSRAAQVAKTNLKEQWVEDIWGTDDIKSICAKVMAYAKARKYVKIKPWPVDKDELDFHARWV